MPQLAAPAELAPPAGRSLRLPLVEELSTAREAWPLFQTLTRLPHALFFDSALPHPNLGRFSYLTADPFAFFRCKNARWEDCSVPTALNELSKPAEPFEAIRVALERFHQDTLPNLPPFQGGVAGLFGYDLCHHIERLPRPRHDEFQTPDLAVGLYDWVIAFDHVARRCWLISTGWPAERSTARRRRAEERLRFVKGLLARAPSFKNALGPNASSLALESLAPQHPLPHLPGLTSNFSRQRYLEVARRAIEYVHAGDCFQVNIAQRLLYPQKEHPLALYGRLRERNPATFSGYFDLGDFVIASSSPERFLQMNSAGEIETRPIKGTRPRGRTPAEDQARSAELRASAKDRAENIMIVDLLRNDLGRVCSYGSIHVPSLCEVETYETVHHLVSAVRGKLRPGLHALDLLKAAFPGGSVTGAPKVRAMEIIAELEPTARGPYCGSLGFIGFDGAMDTNILIRTFTVGRGWVQFPVGGGIVADSTPEREYEETLDKAAGVIRALQ